MIVSARMWLKHATSSGQSINGNVNGDQYIDIWDHEKKKKKKRQERIEEGKKKGKRKQMKELEQHANLKLEWVRLS